MKNMNDFIIELKNTLTRTNTRIEATKKTILDYAEQDLFDSFQ